MDCHSIDGMMTINMTNWYHPELFNVTMCFIYDECDLNVCIHMKWPIVYNVTC